MTSCNLQYILFPIADDTSIPIWLLLIPSIVIVISLVLWIHYLVKRIIKECYDNPTIKTVLTDLCDNFYTLIESLPVSHNHSQIEAVYGTNISDYFQK